MLREIKVSVVVPVYNVEQFLDKCVMSLVHQTYKNIEILLVDDGSIDSSGAMCDDYARRYDNIRVFHKPNGGLSSARNFAMPFLSGDYVTFVDSDDYVELYYIEKMIAPILNRELDEKIDMVICSHVEESINSAAKNESSVIRQDTPSLEIFTPASALEAMCYEQLFGTTACAKLISVHVVKQTPFPIGKNYEDLATMYKMIGESKKIIFINLPMYHYINRSGSLRHSRWNQSVNDVMTATQELLDYIDYNYPKIHSAGVYRYFFSANEYYVRAFSEKDYLQIISPVRAQLALMWNNLKTNDNITIFQKIKFWLMLYSPRVYRRVWQLYKQRR